MVERLFRRFRLGSLAVGAAATIAFAVARPAHADDKRAGPVADSVPASADKTKPPPVADKIASTGPGKPPAAWETAKAERRSGFAIGISVAAGLGASNGYPNDSKKIGRTAYYSKSGLGLATGSSIWLGGALADWLNFGLGFGFSNVFSKGATSPAPLAFFHNDLYPLYGLKGPFRDLGATFEFGLGFPKTVATKGQVTLIDGAGSSYLYAGVFWEPLRVWRLRLGPTLGAHYLFSQSVSRPLALAGLRLTLYTGP